MKIRLLIEAVAPSEGAAELLAEKAGLAAKEAAADIPGAEVLTAGWSHRRDRKAKDA